MHKALAVIALLLSTLAIGAQTVAANHAAAPRPAAHSIITFDVPGGSATYPAGINDAGQVAGSYTTGAVDQGFIRSATGAIVTFEVAGAIDAQVEAINANGEIAGYCEDANGVLHGFVREPSGSTTIFDPPGSTQTVVYAINNTGEVTGTYLDDTNGYAWYGFVRDQLGNITSFNAPDATATFARYISQDGSVTGYFNAGSEEYTKVFIRDNSGAFTTFFPAGAGTASGQGAFPTAINASDEVVGFYVSSSYALHGFSRAENGDITTLNDPHAYRGTDRGFGTYPTAVNSNGEITGFVESPSGNSSSSFGFTVDSSLNYTSFKIQGAGFTNPAGINDSGTTTGAYVDANLVTHGFVRF
jgi:hypothetical protein